MVTLKAHILPHHDLQPPGCRGSGNLPRYHPLWSGFHQQAIDIQPDARSQRFKNLSCGIFFHNSMLQELLK